MKLVWSQPARRRDDPGRTLLLVSVLCLFLGGAVAGVSGRDLQQAPRPLRAAFASLLTTGGVLFVLSLALLAIGKARKPRPARLRLAGSADEPVVSDRERHFGQEEQR